MSRLTLNMRGELQLRILDPDHKIHGNTFYALVKAGCLDEDGVATNEGILKSGLSYDEVYLMVLGADTPYASVVLPKGTEVMVTWREREKNGKKREYIVGYVVNGGNLAEVRLYVTPRHTFETRLTPRLTEPT